MVAAVSQGSSMDTNEIVPFFMATIVIAAVYFIGGIVLVAMGRSFRKKHVYV